MRASIVTVCLATALALASSLAIARAASAADLDGDRYAEPPYDDDSRYGAPDYGGDERDAPPGRYSEAPPQDDRYDQGRYGEDRYDDRALGDPPPGSIKDGYPVPVPAPRYGERAPPPERYGQRFACLDRWQIRRRLRNDGWEGIRPQGGDGGIVYVRAHRIESGRPFALRVDRCSGEVVDARPERRRTFAYRDWRRDRRW